MVSFNFLWKNNKSRATVILNDKDDLNKCVEHINHGQCKLLVQDSATKIKR